MKPEGEVSDIEVLPLLIELSRQKFTGAVRFERDGMIKIVYFREGDVLSASTNDPRDAIDETLVRAGKISRDHVRQAIARRKENESIADALVSLGFLTRKELTWARRLQLVGILRSVADWREGSYGIVQDYLPKRDEGTLFHLPQIIVETVVTDPDRTRVERLTDGGAAIYEKTSAFDEEYRHLGLNEDANAVVSRIDGRTPAGELLAHSTEEPFAVLKLLVAMELLGLTRRVDKPQVKPELLPVVVSGKSLDEESDPQVIHEIREEEITPEIPARRARSRRFLLIPLFLIAVAVIAAFLVARRPVLESSEPAATETAAITAPILSSESPEVALATEPPLISSPLPESPPSEATTRSPESRVSSLESRASGPQSRVASPESRVPSSESIQDPRPETRDPGLGTRDQTSTRDPGVGAPDPTSTRDPRPETRDQTTQEPEASAIPRDLLRERYDVMAEGFARDNASVPYALQIELVCQTNSVTRALEIGGEKIWFVPIQFRGQSCYRVFWGSYLTRTAAEQAVAEVPPAFTEGSLPSVIEVREVLKP